MSFRDEIIKSVSRESELEEKLVDLIRQSLIKGAKKRISDIKYNIRRRAEQKDYKIKDGKRVISGTDHCYDAVMEYSSLDEKYGSVFDDIERYFPQILKRQPWVSYNRYLGDHQNRITTSFGVNINNNDTFEYKISKRKGWAISSFIVYKYTFTF